MPLEPGQSFGHYRIERLIGRGGMGAVYLAEDTKLERKVALKVLPDEFARDAQRLERFQREARSVAALNHPHIVTLYSVEEAGGTPFLTMELVDGDSLDHVIPPGGLELPRVFDIGVAVADALSAAHEKGIVHRDLKPANVMVTKDGRVKVLDFGLAKELAFPAPDSTGRSEAPTRTELTDVGLVVGTVPYMSPEQVGGEAVDARSDIFSLGVVLYEMATGRRPFAGKNQAEQVSSILRDKPPAVVEVRRNAPRHLGRIIDHCLQKQPEDRFQTARDVYNELRELRREVDSPVSVRSTRWRWAAGSTLAVVALAAAVWLWRAGSDKAEDVGAPSPPARATIAETSSVAVLPFTNVSSDEEQEYFSDGLTEELVHALARIPDLKVAGRTSSFAFKGKNEDLRSIGEKLGVASILEGSVRKSGDKVRITAQLVKVADGFHLWSETYDRTLDDIFAVQDDIASSVARALEVTLLGGTAEPNNPDAAAFDLVLQARFVMQVNNADETRRGREMLERALGLSPNYAPAWAEMGLAYLRDYERGLATGDRQRRLDQAREALTRALELDPDLALAHSRIAGVQQAAWQFAQAERSMARALEIAPKDPIVLANAGLLYASLGRFSDAISLTEEAVRLDPLTPNLFVNLANYYIMVGRLDDAEAQCRKSLELRPDNPFPHLILGSLHLLRGRAEQARAALTRHADLLGLGDQGELLIAAVVEHTAGNAEASDAATLELDRRFGAEDRVGVLAVVHAWRGETDAAFASLEKALAEREGYLASIKTDPMLTSLRDDRRWNALLEKIGLPPD